MTDPLFRPLLATTALFHNLNAARALSLDLRLVAWNLEGENVPIAIVDDILDHLRDAEVALRKLTHWKPKE